MKYRCPARTAESCGQRRQASSHSGRASSMPLATIASGSAASTFSTLTAPASVGMSAKTLRPPQSAITSLIRCRPFTVMSGWCQIW